MDYFSVIIIPCRVAKKGVSDRATETSREGRRGGGGVK